MPDGPTHFHATAQEPGERIAHLEVERNALRAAGDELQSAYSRLAEWVRNFDRSELDEDGPPYEVLMDAVGADRLVAAWTEARRGA